MKKIITLIVVLLMSVMTFAQTKSTDVPTSIFYVSYNNTDVEVIDKISFSIFDEDRLFETKFELIVNKVELYSVDENKEILLAEFSPEKPIEDISRLELNVRKNKSSFSGKIKAVVFLNGKKVIYETLDSAVASYVAWNSFSNSNMLTQSISLKLLTPDVILN